MTHSYNKSITESKNRAYFYRACSLTWIVFSIYMFEINEFFFSLTGILALTALFTISIKRISVDSANVKIEQKRLIPYINSTKTIPLNTIKRVEFEEGSFDRNTVLIEIARTINAAHAGLSYINFYFKDRPRFRFKAIGTKTESKDMVANINKIKNNCSQH